MHVAVSGWFWNRPETGSGQYVQRLMATLAEMEPALRLTIALPFPPSASADLRVDTTHAQLIYRPTPHTQRHKLWWEQVGMPRFAREHQADLLHIPYWAPPVVSPVTSVVTIHDIIPLLLPAYRGDARVRLYTAFVSAAASRSHLVLTDSEAARGDILQHLRLSPSRVRAIPLAVDSRYTARAATEDPVVRQRLSLPSDYILYLGGFDVRKNLAAVFAAFRILYTSQAGDIHLVVGGRLPAEDTAFAPDPRRLARDAGLPNHAVQFLDYVSEEAKPALYRGARAFIFPSLYEGFGLPPLEALACGTPVVGSRRSSLPEVVGNAGVMLEPDDIAGMAGALIQLVTDDAFHAEMQRQALRQAQRFSWTRTASETLQAFQDVLR